MHFGSDNKINKQSPEKTDPGTSRQQLRQSIPQPKKKSRKAIGNYTYHQQHVIGWGYTSKVYKGKTLDKSNSMTVAIKKISITNLDNLHMGLLQNQVRIVKKLKHPNVVKVYDILYTKKNCYIVMELCEGGSLEKKIKQIDSLTEKIKIITDLCAAFKYLVSIGVVHRDIKPGNILKSSDGQWKLADFGFATDIALALKDDKVSVGTPIYMAPESLDIRKYSFKSDIFSLGVVFYQILTKGKLLWFEKSKKKILQAILQFNFNQIQIDHPFSKIFLLKMLNPNPDERISPQHISIQKFLSVQYDTKINSNNNDGENLYDLAMRTDQMIQMNHIINLIINDQMLLNQKDLGLQLYGALKVQKQAIMQSLEGYSHSKYKNLGSNFNRCNQKLKNQKFINPNSFDFINYTHDLAAKLILKMSAQQARLQFRYRNYDPSKINYQKNQEKYIMSPTNQNSLSNSLISLRKNLLCYREYLQKILGFYFNQSNHFSRTQLRKVMSDISLRTMTVDIS